MKVYIDNVFEEKEKNGFHELTKELLEECEKGIGNFGEFGIYVLAIQWDSELNCPRLHVDSYTC